MIDDYSKIEYAILKELYECKKENLRVDLTAISPERFHITDIYDRANLVYRQTIDSLA